MKKIILILLMSAAFVISWNIYHTNSFKHHLIKVYAEDDEEEKEEDKEEQEDNEDEKEEDDEENYNVDKQIDQLVTEQTKDKVVNVEPITQIQYINVIDPGYDIDTDGDGLVDALDPDPKISQYEYFTDSDNDGVPNAYDEYKYEDDFKVRDNEDKNNNGIIDFYE